MLGFRRVIHSPRPSRSPHKRGKEERDVTRSGAVPPRGCRPGDLTGRIFHHDVTKGTKVQQPQIAVLFIEMLRIAGSPWRAVSRMPLLSIKWGVPQEVITE